MQWSFAARPANNVPGENDGVDDHQLQRQRRIACREEIVEILPAGIRDDIGIEHNRLSNMQVGIAKPAI